MNRFIDITTKTMAFTPLQFIGFQAETTNFSLWMKHEFPYLPTKTMAFTPLQFIQEAMLSLDDAISSHMISAERLGFPKELTNRPAPIKYWKMLNELTSPKEEVSLSPFQFFVTQPKVFAPVAYV